MRKADNIFNKILFISLLLFLISLPLSPQIGLADTRGGGFVNCGGVDNPCEMSDFLITIHKVLDFAIYTLAPIFVVMMVVIGGLYIFASAGNPGQVGKGKTIIKNALIGYLIVLGAWLILNIVLSLIGVAEWTGLRTWYEITL